MYDQSRVLMTFVFFLGSLYFSPPVYCTPRSYAMPYRPVTYPPDSLMRISHSRRSRPLPLYYTRHVGLFLVHINYRYCPPAILFFFLVALRSALPAFLLSCYENGIINLFYYFSCFYTIYLSCYALLLFSTFVFAR